MSTKPQPTRVCATYKPDGVETYHASVTLPFDYLYPEGVTNAEETVKRIMSHLMAEAVRLWHDEPAEATDT